MKEIIVNSHNVPATARSKNYQNAQVTTASSGGGGGGGGGATSPSATPTTGGATDTAKVAQNLAADSTDWSKILRKDIDDRTDYDMTFGKNITVDGQAILNDVVANTGTFAGLLKAASATITGALLASTVNATTVNATTFIGDMQGNAATATKLKTARNIWGQSFDGTADISGDLLHVGNIDMSDSYGYLKFKSPFCFYSAINNNCLSFYNTSLSKHQLFIESTGNIGIDTQNPLYTLDVYGNVRIASDLYADATVGTRNFASRTVGWQVNAQGAADFRSIYSDELRVQAFTADISQALAGSDYLTKSVSKLSANFVVPSVNSTVRIIVDDIEGMPATQCFSNNDYIRFRAFNRTSGLTIANVWGTVVLDTTFGTNGFLSGTQAYTFTCKATSGAGLTVFKGSEVLDYGTTGSGMISRTTLDAQGSPYEQIATWVNDPSVSTNYTVHARLGNLSGIANCNGYGIYTDNGFFTGKIVIGDLTKNNNFLSFDQTNGLQIKLGGTSVATTTDVSTAVNNVQIGGRNLIGGTNDFSGLYHNGVLVDNDYLNFTSLSNNNWPETFLDICTFNPLYLKINQYYTLSFYAKSTVSGDKIRSYFYPNLEGDRGDGLTYTTLTTEWKRYSITWYRKGLEATHVIVARLENGGGLGNVSVCGVKFEEGNKATTYTPAPEDVDANIATAKSTAISKAATNAAALYVTQTAYSAQVSVLQNSINAKVSQTDFNALGTRVGSAESTITQHSTDIASKVAQTDYTGNTIASLINQTATTVTIAASKINLVGAVTIEALDSRVTAAALGGATPSDVSTAVNNIQIGGRNLARNSKGDFTYNLTDVYNYTATMCNAYWVGNKSANIVISGDVEYSNIVFTGTGTPFFYIQGLQDLTGWNYGLGIVLTDKIHNGNGSFHFSQGIYSAGILNNNYWNFGFRSDYITGTVTFRNIKVEYGTKETSYTPAPEDVAQDVTNKVNAVSAAHGGFTFLDSNSIYTGTLTAGQVNAVGISASSITTGTLNADRISGNSITGDKIVANSITGDKLVMNTITALGNVTAGSFNIGSGKFVVDSGGNLTAVNANINGTLNGVSGTFNYLQAVGSNGKFWFNNHFDAMSIENEDFNQLGIKNNRTVRFYASDIRCKGSFGALCLNMARVHDTVIDYYVNGYTTSYVRFNLQSNGVGGYYIPLYPTSETGYSLAYGNATLDDVFGFPVDLLIFNNSANYHYEMLPGACGKKVIAVNANDKNTVYLAINGDLNNWTLAGGVAHTFINIREFMTPSVSSSVHGAGWLSCGGHDNDWM